MNPQDMRLPTPLLAPLPGPRTGATREGLHSVFRRICEHNQVTVNDVLGRLVLPFIGTPSHRLTKMSAAVHLIDRGCGVSGQLVERIQCLTTIGDLSCLTARELVELRGVGTLAIATHRKWCPACLNDDLETELGAYDRLLWSLADVDTCPVHLCKLQTTCQTCGCGPFSILTGRDTSGHCPKCQGWLGGLSIAIDRNRDLQSHYLLWVAKSFADLLDSPLPAGTDIGSGFRKILVALTEKHFGGVVAQLASAIERNRSVVGTWLAGRASPSWRALLELSFAFQVPLPEILLGQTDAVAFSRVQQLPLAVLTRVTSPRKLPERRNVDDVQAFLARIERNELPSVLTMMEVGKRLGIHPRELSRIVQADAARLSRTLASRRVTIRERKHLSREQAIREAVPKAVSNLLVQGVRVTRRAVDQQLALAGLPVRRQEAPLVRELVRAATGDKTAEVVSGNKRAALDSGN
jgi:hypothetical protein